ncbi:MAG: FHA domain-containing protein [Planctomycetota bacterium]
MRQCQACGFDRCDDHAEKCRQCGSILPEPEEAFSNKALAAAWWHYLEIPGAGTVELVPGKAFLMGRDPRSDLLLKTATQPEVARIFWTDGNVEATLEPTGGASAGVKIDGMLVPKTRKLKGGEEIQIGRLVMRYAKKGSAIEGAISARKVGNRRPDPRRGVETGPKPRGRARSNTALEPGLRARGELGKAVASPSGSGDALEPTRRGVARPAAPAGQRPADIAKALEKAKAFGTLNVAANEGRGWVTVRAGAPQHASFDGRSGPVALEAILRLGPCRVNLVSGTPTRTAGSRLSESFSTVLQRLQGRALGPARRGSTTSRRPRPGRPGPPPRRR